MNKYLEFMRWAFAIVAGGMTLMVCIPSIIPYLIYYDLPKFSVTILTMLIMSFFRFLVYLAEKCKLIVLEEKKEDDKEPYDHFNNPNK